MYLQELRRYKPPPIKAADAEGHVLKFNPPKPPPSPEESNIASELKEYEAQQVEIEERSDPGEAAVEDNDLFEDYDEEEGSEKPGHSSH